MCKGTHDIFRLVVPAHFHWLAMKLFVANHSCSTACINSHNSTAVVTIMSNRSITRRIVVAVAVVASTAILGSIASNKELSIFYKTKKPDESHRQVATWLNLAFVGAAEQVTTRRHSMVEHGMPQPSSRMLVESTNSTASPTHILSSDVPSAKPSQHPSAILTIQVSRE